jgi:hypothetical protein
MKKFFVIAMLSCCALCTHAQQLKGTFKADLNAGYAIPTEGFGVKSGVMFTVEPHYYVTDNFVAGLRLEGAFLGYQAESDDELFSFFGSTILTGDFYFSKSKVKPFIGMGAGLYTRHYIFEDYTGEDLYTSGYGSIKLGFMGRAGFEMGHVRLTGSYNVVAANFSYAAFTIGYVIGE